MQYQRGLALATIVFPCAKSNRSVVIAAVHGNGLALEFANHTLQRDPLVVLVAVRSCGLALRWMAPRYQEEEIVRAATEENLNAKEYGKKTIVRAILHDQCVAVVGGAICEKKIIFLFTATTMCQGCGVAAMSSARGGCAAVVDGARNKIILFLQLEEDDQPI